MSKAEEQALINFSQGAGKTPGEALDAYLKQKEIDAVMRQVVADQRGGNVHSQLSSYLPPTRSPGT